jgi:hypothetical protein
MKIGEFDLLDLRNKNSFIRQTFNKNFSLDPEGIPIFVPHSFKTLSFYPLGGLNLEKISKKLKTHLFDISATPEFMKKTIPGVIEAIKNAYEHGNKKDQTKQIIFLRKMDGRNLQYIIGNEGGKIDGNFFPYLDLIRQERYKGGLIIVPGFYAFCGKDYAPEGHSGVGIKDMHQCFQDVHYFKNQKGGLSVFLSKPFSQLMR